MQVAASNQARTVTRISRGDLGNLNQWHTIHSDDSNMRRGRGQWSRLCPSVVEGISQSQDKKLPEAISKYTKAIEIDSECVDAYVARGVFLLNNHGSHSAASLNSLTRSIPTNSNSNDAYAFVFDDTKDTVALPPPSSKKRKKEKSEMSEKKKKHKSRDKDKKKT
ncbi:hypothetical protein CcCBS67573_g09713 [Chytriomyces confervae]|uniref:Uncharacterized protein n=1 Tax=Chytriomyces confervae TaxID=246404 RepID=A0A507DNT8_9FUNG|nr:hypothetical protein CcCBS67573_g09713 [Chytriomyces confervae]